MLDPYRDRVVIAELDSTMPVEDAVDIVLYDSFAQPESDHEEIGVLVDNPGRAGLWSTPGTFTPISSRAPGGRAPTATCRRRCPPASWSPRWRRCTPARWSSATSPARARSAPGLDWPGRGEGLTDRESEILALITQGKSNADVARLTYLSPNTVKSYIRTIYRKIGVGSRTQAVLWGVQHGFTPDHHRIEHWRGGP